jgi:hypothetical protein
VLRDRTVTVTTQDDMGLVNMPQAAVTLSVCAVLLKLKAPQRPWLWGPLLAEDSVCAALGTQCIASLEGAAGAAGGGADLASDAHLLLSTLPAVTASSSSVVSWQAETQGGASPAGLEFAPWG